MISPSSPLSPQPSPWHSPVPYLFGGLAAMMGLIAFALLVLACSYWKLKKIICNMAGEEKLTVLATPILVEKPRLVGSSWRSNLSALTEASLSSEEDKDENHKSANHIP
ncbi:glutamine dumper 2-like protein [Tanacetum coccineum]